MNAGDFVDPPRPFEFQVRRCFGLFLRGLRDEGRGGLRRPRFPEHDLMMAARNFFGAYETKTTKHFVDIAFPSMAT